MFRNPNIMTQISQDFFLRNDILTISRQLLGKYLMTNINGNLTGGIICETEAYAGIHDKASHAYNNRKTERTKVMFQSGGKAYVYLCYGIHHLFNVVTNKAGIPHAVLVRGVIPKVGIPVILKRRAKSKITKDICIGPGKVSQALGITTSDTGIPLSGKRIWIEDKDLEVSDKKIISTPRIGVDYAGEDARLPYRFVYQF